MIEQAPISMLKLVFICFLHFVPHRPRKKGYYFVEKLIALIAMATAIWIAMKMWAQNQIEVCSDFLSDLLPGECLLWFSRFQAFFNGRLASVAPLAFYWVLRLLVHFGRHIFLAFGFWAFMVRLNQARPHSRPVIIPPLRPSIPHAATFPRLCFTDKCKPLAAPLLFYAVCQALSSRLLVCYTPYLIYHLASAICCLYSLGSHLTVKFGGFTLASGIKTGISGL